MNNDESNLTLRVYRGMTLSDLAVHFGTTVRALRQANPDLHSSRLLAGEAYVIPIGHLDLVHHRVIAGDTMWSLGRMVDAPTSYSIRTWNCLDRSAVRAGETLLLFEPHRAAASGVSTLGRVKRTRAMGS